MSSARRALAVVAIALTFSLGVVEAADAARRGGGGFGSRGARTYSMPRATPTAPSTAAPINRSMTSRDQAAARAQAPAANRTGAPAAAQRGGFLRRWGGPILGGLLLGGLLGMLMGNGFGGMAGMLGLLLQVAVIGLLVALAMRFFRRRGQQQQQPAYAGAPAAAAGPQPVTRDMFSNLGANRPQPAPVPGVRPGARPGDEIGITDADFDAFERLLGEVQTAYGREDYAALRERVTPEVMSYFAEELAQNATAGRRNEIRDVQLLQGDLSEAWREDDADYATVAVRFCNIDIVVDRTTGAVVEGEPNRPIEVTEVWTFIRDRRANPWGGGEWKLSAVQGQETA